MVNTMLSDLQGTMETLFLELMIIRFVYFTYLSIIFTLSISILLYDFLAIFVH